MNFTKFKDWALLGLLSGSVFILWLMYQSIATLNVNMAVVIERMVWFQDGQNRQDAKIEKHDLILDAHDDRLRHVEIKN